VVQDIDWRDPANWGCNNGSMASHPREYDGGIDQSPFETVFVKVKPFSFLYGRLTNNFSLVLNLYHRLLLAVLHAALALLHGPALEPEQHKQCSTVQHWNNNAFCCGASQVSWGTGEPYTAHYSRWSMGLALGGNNTDDTTLYSGFRDTSAGQPVRIRRKKKRKEKAQ